LALNRRDFLTFKVERRQRVAELSCERLYMLLLDVQLTGESHDSTDISWNSGEPPAVYRRRSPDDLFEQIRRDLTGIDVLRIIHREWLNDESLAPRLQHVVTDFQAHGGRVDLL
jgi:hypothetical protein